MKLLCSVYAPAIEKGSIFMISSSYQTVLNLTNEIEYLKNQISLIHNIQ